METTREDSLSQDAVSLHNAHYHDENRDERSETPPTQHRRGYQACDPCRKRKVKCDLGSVDNPRPPPCVRCRRESKRCEFSATRRKRKTSDVEPEQETPLQRDKRMLVGEVKYGESSSGIGGNTKSEPSYSTPTSAPFDNGALHKYAWPDKSPHSVGQKSPDAQKERHQPIPISANHYHDGRSIQSGLYPPQHGRGQTGTDVRQHVMNKTAADLLFPTISNSHDALHLLSEAAGRTEDLNRQRLENKGRQSTGPYGSNMSVTSPVMPRNAHHSYSKQSNRLSTDAFSDTSAEFRKHNFELYNDPGYLDAVRAWSRLRFVRAGWLSVEEAMDYIAYYYKHLAPLSSIVIPDFSPPSTHRTLLTDEPVLAVTMLTTASRYMKPKGDGAHTRGYYIHDRLWAYLRGMIERLFWGQEKFTGNSVGMGTPRSLDIPLPAQGQASLRGHLRSLGTIEALLILTDWHPRNLHFPPGDDENTLLDADALLPSQSRNDGDNESRGASGGGVEGRLAFQKWLEPTWRSDRMSWMLLSTAQALAFELGVFDQKPPSAPESVAEQVRKRRVRRLIIVYITQGSGRLGIPSMLPLDRWSDHLDPSTPADAPESEIAIERMQDLWIQISKIMSLSNIDLFPSKEYTSDLIKTGRYKQKIAEFLPHLENFRAYFASATLSPQMQNILTIEYEYTRIYVNCLALQAVVERWTTMNNEPSGKSSGSSSLRVLMEIYRVNEKYIQEVVDASRKILHTVLDSLIPDDQLKHCPVRTFFRILSAMIFILKTFTLGATEDDVRVSLDLQDRTIEALRTCVVDDVHLSNTISRLLELLTANIRTRFLRFAPTDRGVDGEGQERASQPTSRVASPRPAAKDGSNSARQDPNTHWQHQMQASNHNKFGYQFNQGASESQQHHPIVTHHDPLAGIPAQPINSSNIGVSFMPPPPSVYYNYYGSNGPSPKLDDSNSIAQSVHEGGLPDWFALPLDQFFNSSASGVDQGLGGTGPMLGEFDMLEVLLNEQLDKDGNVANVSGGNGVENMDSVHAHNSGNHSQNPFM